MVILFSFLLEKYTPTTSRNESNTYYFDFIMVAPITEMPWIKEKFVVHFFSLHFSFFCLDSLAIAVPTLIEAMGDFAPSI